MADQSNPELPVEEVAPEDEQLIHPAETPSEVPTETPVYKYKMPVIIPIAGIIVVFITIAIVVLVVTGMNRKSQGAKTSSTVTPTIQTENQPTQPVLSTETPSASGEPILVSLPSTSLPLILEVSEVGTKASAIKHEYTMNMILQEGDKLNVMQRKEDEITGYPGYVAGAVDMGLRIEHGNAYLDIVPVFEGIGFGLTKKLDVKTIKNTELTDKPIYRLDMSQMQTDMAVLSQKGFVYTTQYVENQGSCSSTFGAASGKTYPACINGGLQLDLAKSSPVSVICYGESANITWCDTLVKSLTISE